MRKEKYNEEGLSAFIEELIDSNRLEGMEAGIARLMLDKGYDSLSKKQRYIFDKSIENHTIDECQRCGVDIPWCEMLEALVNGGYCGYCQHMMEKINEE